jgi:hypothetical protein
MIQLVATVFREHKQLAMTIFAYVLAIDSTDTYSAILVAQSSRKKE